LVGSPLLLANPDPLAILEPTLGRFDRAAWRLFRFDTLQQEYKEFSPGDGDFDFLPGRGFWLVTRSGGTLTLSGTPVSATQPFTLTLQPGPQQITTPFNLPIDWSGCVVRTLPVGISPALFGYQGEYLLASEMTPMVGYWVNNETDLPVTITIDPSCAKVEPTTAITSVTPAVTIPPSPIVPSLGNGWRMQLSATAGDLKDTDNYLGVDIMSQDGHDGLDCPEPPPLHGLVVSFPHPEWDTQRSEYATDIRGVATGAPQVWDLIVRTNRVQTPVQLTWSVRGGGGTLLLLDVETGQVVNMGQLGAYTYDSGDGGVRHFQVTAR
jgi:hypothetical protein